MSVNIAAGAEAPAGLDLADYLRVVRVYWKAIVAFTLLATLTAFGWTVLQPKIYSSDSSGIVVTPGSDNVSLSLAGDSLAKAKVKNYESVAKSRLVADRVIASLELKTTADALLGTISVKVPLDTAEIRVTAQSPDPATAQRVADAWVNGLAAQVEAIETATPGTATPDAGTSPDAATAPAATASAVRILPLGKAVLPTSPVSPNVKLTLALGALIGLALGVAYALVRRHLDRRIRNATEIERLFDVPVIGTLPVDHRLDEKSTILDAGAAAQLHDAGGAMAEALRELRTNLSFLDVDQPPRIIVVTSSMQAEGKSTVTANLAVTMAAAGENVVVVDGDLRRPTLVDVFNLVPGAGVTDVLTGTAELEDVLQPWGALPNLSVLGSGRIPPNPSELLGSKAMKNMLNALAENAIVLIDAPPLLPVTDAAVLSRVADGAIVVIRTGRTTQEQLGQSLGNLEKVKGRILGAVLNYVPTKGTDAYSYYGTYTSAPETQDLPELAQPDAMAHEPQWDTEHDDVLEPAAAGRRARA
ncbi:capsular exopolysaccharide synthesis family protein [Arthrobacter sp. PvP102]|uniref:polysaccharide biosynthesis tyrosine autokinase n=1 Tax=unclassified Arthrobacter TaxID=235627 RepID=UPI001AE92DAA|nr:MULTISPECIES: polysaccharide biosynthesis tyrosine autokinase [unclassified Arthrobacter]MBP1232536.1 capsular exopolysaccharide synthesis family protein [Arthrobacter sp. PvP103]MBP1237671.1 capsular exopolysaccharide synthesis family protein [Arthrobacter sp. PvP102]